MKGYIEFKNCFKKLPVNKSVFYEINEFDDGWILQEIKLFRTNMAILCNFDWVPLPIMYPQLIVLAVHTYFLICVLSRQFIISDDAANKSRVGI